MIFFDQLFGRFWFAEYKERRLFILSKVQYDALLHNWSLLIRPHPASQKEIWKQCVNERVNFEINDSKIPFELELALGLIYPPKVIGTICSSAAFYWMFMLDNTSIDMPKIYFYYSVLDLFGHKDPHPEMRTLITKLCEKFPEKIRFVRLKSKEIEALDCYLHNEKK